MAKKVLFIDRDGTIIKETADEQIDAFEKMIFYPKAFTWLGKIAQELDYELVMITNQDGLGTDIFPEDTFWPVHNFIIKSFKNEGVVFSKVFLDKTFPHENKDTRKPGTGKSSIETGLAFFDHMLEKISKHGMKDLEIQVKGDLEVDGHHTIEDTAIALCEVFAKALGNKLGIERYGFCLPMDDCMAQVAIDFGGRNWLVWEADSKREMIGKMPTEMFYHFFKSFTDGIQYLHLVDLDGAKSKHIVNHKILEAIASKTTLKVDFGGGLKTDDDLRIAFESGASQITGGSIAVKEPETFKKWLQTHGSDKIILGADAHNRKIAISGWLEEYDDDVIDFIKDYQKEGVDYVICTNISKDGMLEGPRFELYEEILECCQPEPVEGQGKDALRRFQRNSSIKLIASGGISTFEELPKLAALLCEATIIGKAIYENRISLKELEKYILNG